MLTIDKLNNFGAKVSEGLGRCLNNEAFYFRLIGMAAEDASFDILAQALAKGDLEAAFGAAHTLKGAMGNLALEPIFRPASQLTELLRSKTTDGCEEPLKEIKKQREALREIIRD